MATTISDSGAHPDAVGIKIPAMRNGQKGYITDTQIAALTNGGDGDMSSVVYDPGNVAGDAFDMDNMADGSSKVAMTTSERSKLSGIDTSATANSSDATLLARANHTGSQAISTVTDLQSALDGKATSAQGGLADSAVQPEDLGDLATKDAVAISDITATGTPSGTTYLRGDGVWGTPTGEGGGIGSLVEDTSPQLGGDLDLNGNDILGMVIGEDVQAYSANLAEFAGVNPSANGLSLVSAADYAAMRGLLDLEAGTDFYSMSATDGAISSAISALSSVYEPLLTLGITTEGSPAAGDFLLMLDADGNLVKVDWDDLPSGGGGGGVAEGDSPTWTGAHTFAAGTLTDGAPAISITQTWNDAAETFDALTVDITNTNSAAASRLLNLTVGGTTMFRVNRSGNGYFAGIIQVGGTQDAGNNAYIGGGGDLIKFSHVPGDFPNDVKASIHTSAGRFIAGNSGQFSWGNPSTAETTLQLHRDGANDTMAQRRGTNAQTFRLYNTHTDASNYERLKLRWNSNVLELGTEAGGTGTARALSLTSVAMLMPNIPTSDPSVAGQLWNDGGVLKISAG